MLLICFAFDYSIPFACSQVDMLSKVLYCKGRNGRGIYIYTLIQLRRTGRVAQLSCVFANWIQQEINTDNNLDPSMFYFIQ